MRNTLHFISRVTGLLLLAEGLSMLPPAAVSVSTGDRQLAAVFMITSLTCASIGALITFRRDTKKIVVKPKDGYLISFTAWILCTLIGAVPYLFSGYGYTFTESIFESSAGMTTTGATVLYPDIIPRGLVLWKSICNWVGGIGIIILAVGLFPKLGTGGQIMAEAEMTSPTLNKNTAKISSVAKQIYMVYAVLTACEIILLIIGGMDAFTSITTALSCISTAGIFINSLNAAYFTSTYIQAVIAVFTFLASVNFMMFVFLFTRKFHLLRNAVELKMYVRIILCSTAALSLILYFSGIYTSPIKALVQSLFHAVSFSSTSGYSFGMYDHWPSSAKFILLVLMIIGGCSCSTAGSIKVIRFSIMLSLIKRGIHKRIHFYSVKPVKLGNQVISAKAASNVTVFLLLYLIVFFIGTFLIALENKGLDLTLESVLAMLSNTGVSFTQAGLSINYADFNGFSQIVFSILMLCGRLETYSIVLVFTKVFWRPDRTKTVL